MLGVLRRDDDGTEPDRAPLPGIGQLGELLEQARATGLAVSFTVEGVPQPLPDGAALAAYRIVQESLTNTRKHGGPRATAQVLLRYLEDALLLRVTDDGLGARAASDGAGHGLTGHARAGRRLRRLGAGRPAPGRRLPGDGAAAADILRAHRPARHAPRRHAHGVRGRQAGPVPHEHPDPARRRPGTGPGRVPDGARRPAGHGGGRRGGRRAGRDPDAARGRPPTWR